MSAGRVHEELVCAGFGGQGIMFLGKLLAQSAMSEGLEVTYLPSYGAEVRGGTAHCNVVISMEEIASPVIGAPTSVIVMNHPSLVKFESRVRSGGLLIVNSSLSLASPRRGDIEAISIAATEMADGLGNIQVANMIALGCYLESKSIVPQSRVIECLRDVLPQRRYSLLSVNEKALREGSDFFARRGKVIGAAARES